MARFLAVCLFVAAGLAQAPQQPSAQEAPPEPVLRISVTLVQVDAVVTDAKGRHIPDLTANDFEVYQDGKLQRITHFSYVAGSRPAAPIPARVADKSAPPPPPAAIKPSQVHRTVALVADDLGLSFESMALVRQALKKFVDEQMQPGDLVAVVRTGAGMGAFQQFTSDKRQLYAAIDRLRWNFLGRGGVSAFAPIQSDPNAPGQEEGTEETIDRAEEFREDYFSVGTLGALNFIIRGLKDLPGRKSVVLMTDNLRIFNREGYSERVLESLQRLTDLANRASVVIYSIDARGLPTLSLTAADNVSARGTMGVTAALARRRSDYWESQNGMNYLADQTGGMFLHETNDIGASLSRVLDDQSGYYLIGYQPKESTFKDKERERFHTIKVKMKRAGLRVRSRNGFYGVPEQEARPVYRGRDQQLAAALISPFASAGIPLRLTGLFADNPKTGPYVYSLLHIGARELSFTAEPDGWHKAVLDILMTTYGADGEQIDRTDRTYTLRLRGDTYQKALSNGFVYALNHAVKKPGAYQLRVAVRDAGSEKAGSASQFLEIPDVKKGRLALSGIVVRSGAPPKPAAEGEGQKEESDPLGSPAVRVFQAGADIFYTFQVLNAQVDAASKQAQLETQLRLFRDTTLVYSGRRLAIDPSGQQDPKRMLLGGRFKLGSKLEPGEYVMQLTATDKLATDKRRTASQYIDFEVR